MSPILKMNHVLCNTKCTVNPLHHPDCPGYYPTDLSKVTMLIVTEAPGKNEVSDVNPRPLIGASGKVLWKALFESGIGILANSEDKYIWAYGFLLKPPDHLALDNVVHCQPPNNRTPSILECIYCSKHLAERIRLLPNLKVIVTLGDVSLSHLTGQNKILKRRGMPFNHYLTSLGREVIILPTLHPAFILRQRQWYEVFVKDLIKAKRLCDEGLPKYEVEARDLTPEAVQELLQTGFAFDIETTGFDFTTCQIIGCSFANEEKVAYHAWKDNPIQWTLAKQLLEAPIFKVAQNNMFDVPFLNYHGVDIKGVEYDTCYGQHLIQPDLPSNLGYIASLYTDSPYYKEQRDELIAGKLSRSQTKQYCCHDSGVTWGSYVKQHAELEQDPNLLDVFTNITMPCSKVANNLVRKGVKINREKIDSAKESLDVYLNPIQEQFRSFNCNLNAPIQVRELMSHIGCPVPDTRAATMLQAYQRTQNPLIPTIMKWRKLSKVRSTFIVGLQERLDTNDLLHTSYRVDGTRNSRWSSRNPNLQNIPPDVRKIFIPTSQDRVFVQADYTRLELFVAGVLSGDKQFLHDVETTPIHDVLAEEIYGSGYTKHQRLLTKTVIFGTLYGRSAHSIAVAFGITIAEAKRIQHTIAKKYVRLTEWVKASHESIISQGYLRSAFGRIRYFDGGNIVSQASNYPIQAAAGDITNTSLIALDNMLDLRLTVHDSIVAQCLPNHVSVTVNTLREIMSRPIPQLGGYSFPVTIEQGPTWGDMTVIEEAPKDIEDEIDSIFADDEEEYNA